MTTSAAATRSCSGAPRSASSPRRPAIAGSGRCSRRTRRWSSEVPVAGREPGRGHAGRPRPRRSRRPGARASVPTASRSSASARSPTARTSTRPVNSLFRADPTRGDDPVLGALLELVRSGRHVARRRRGRRPASPCRSPARSTRRAVRWSPSTRRPRCSRVCSRSPRTTRSRTSGPSTRGGRRPTRARAASTRPTSP